MLKKQLWTAASLLVVFSVLAGIALWDDDATKKEEKAKELENKITSLVPEDVTFFSYLDKSITIEAVRKDGLWRLKQPVSSKADQDQLNALIKAVTEYKYKKEIEVNEASWNDFGLKEPDRVITLANDTDKLRLFLGNAAPVGYSVYLRLDEASKVYLGGKQIMTATAKSLRDLRDKAVIDLAPSSIEKMTYKGGTQPAIVVERDGKGFRITTPMAVDASSDEINDFLGATSRLKADDFIDAPEPELVASFASNDAVNIIFTDGSGADSFLSLVEHKGKLYATRKVGALVYQLPDSSKGKFEKTLRDFRDRRLLAMDSANVTAVSIDGEAYKKVDGDWVPSSQVEAEKKESLQHIQNLVVDLEYAKAEEILEAAGAKQTKAPPRHRIELSLKGEDSRTTLDVWDYDEKKEKYLVKTSKKPNEVYLLERRHLAAMKPDSDKVKL